jgi:hypothetical protein
MRRETRISTNRSITTRTSIDRRDSDIDSDDAGKQLAAIILQAKQRDGSLAVDQHPEE